MSEQSEAARMNGTGPSACSVSGCITGYWTDGYDTQVYHGDDINDYRGAIETTEFLFCPICGKKILQPNDKSHFSEVSDSERRIK